jgi:putative FmdB family regulatory protein
MGNEPSKYAIIDGCKGVATTPPIPTLRMQEEEPSPMPTYVYRCENCGHRFEAWQHMTDDPLTTCPQCEGPVHRVLFPASIVFKGSGFYSTDNRRSQIATEPAASAGDAGKSESKPTETGTASSGGTGGSSDAAASTPKTSTSSTPE